MPIKTDVWTVGLVPNKLRQSRLASEHLLEEMIISSPSILSDEWMLIGRQETTGMGGRTDLLVRISLIVTGHFANNVTDSSTRLRGV